MFQNKSKIFQKSNQQLHLVTHHYSLIVKAQFGAVDKISMALGLGDATNRNKAEKIEGLPKIKAMEGGVYFSMFVDEEGNVWVCGENDCGELGVGHNNQINTPVQNNNLSGIVAVAGGHCYFSMFLDEQGNVFTCGHNECELRHGMPLIL